jgi:hypothetical protein
MASALQPLRDEHKALLANIEDLRSVADVAGEVPGGLLRQGLADACRFLADTVIPQLEAEARAVFPRIVRLVGAAIVTAPMERDLAEIRRLTSVLRQLHEREGEVTSREDRETLRRALYALSILIPLHFRKEEDLYFDMLENALDTREVQRLFQDMDSERVTPAAPPGHPNGSAQS